MRPTTRLKKTIYVKIDEGFYKTEEMLAVDETIQDVITRARENKGLDDDHEFVASVNGELVYRTTPVVPNMKIDLATQKVLSIMEYNYILVPEYIEPTKYVMFLFSGKIKVGEYMGPEIEGESDVVHYINQDFLINREEVLAVVKDV